MYKNHILMAHGHIMRPMNYALVSRCEDGIARW